jgi:hypothetical protein
VLRRANVNIRTLLGYKCLVHNCPSDKKLCRTDPEVSWLLKPLIQHSSFYGNGRENYRRFLEMRVAGTKEQIYTKKINPRRSGIRHEVAHAMLCNVTRSARFLIGSESVCRCSCDSWRNDNDWGYTPGIPLTGLTVGWSRRRKDILGGMSLHFKATNKWRPSIAGSNFSYLTL